MNNLTLPKMQVKVRTRFQPVKTQFFGLETSSGDPTNTCGTIVTTTHLLHK